MKNPRQMGSALLVLLLGVATTYAASATIPAGTTISVRIADPIDSEKNYIGETFRATLDSPLTVDGKLVIPQGAEAIGRLTAVEQSRRIRGRALVALELTALNFNGKSVAIQTSAYQEASPSRGKETAKIAGAGAVLGTIVGAVAGGKKGALIGAGLGAAGGAAGQAIRGTERIQIPAESLVIFTLQSPVPVDAGL